MPFFLTLIIDSIAPSPTFLTATSPNLIFEPTTVNSLLLSFMSGGRTSIAWLRHSAIYFTTPSMEWISLVSNEAISSTGKWALRKAVRYAIRAYAALWDLLNPYPPNFSISSNIFFALSKAMPFSFAPCTKRRVCLAIIAGIFFPIALRKSSASAME